MICEHDGFDGKYVRNLDDPGFCKKERSHTICWAYEVLEKLPRARGTDDRLAYRGYRKLYKDTKLCYRPRQHDQ